MMDLRRVQVLRVLADRGTVTAAAEALYVTPSAVSQQLRALADELGVELLVRDGRRVRLTAAAHALLEHADALQEHWERARADLGGSRRTLRFCGVSSAVAALLSPVAAAMHARDPRRRIELIEEESEECFRLLLAEQADLAVVLPTPASPPVDDPRFEQRVLHEDPQDLLVPTGHPLAGRRAVTLADAAAERWIVKPRENDTYDLLLSACAAAGFTPAIAHQVKEWFAISRLVADGLGVCLLPRIVPIPAEHAVTRVPLTGNPRPVRRLIACLRRGSAGQPDLAEALAVLDGVVI
ncbi:LysR family transcriptional regulator [Amycolatopsis sp. 195334CR]|uniref:LysR family transcriptional regulator n=1 Tax=Amycolatopsis sp. 195334CR TaxID=2814588 RepID=UPI001A8FCEC6|nr:LysR family transcriptional regulator [Amycolatopsis sp. 195334CR]MBN6037295.1 LysR family transcriptional regulator [Amycolatopsis sp. 195334CR]